MTASQLRPCRTRNRASTETTVNYRRYFSLKTLMLPCVLLRILIALCFLRSTGTEALRIRVAFLIAYLASKAQYFFVLHGDSRAGTTIKKGGVGPCRKNKTNTVVRRCTIPDTDAAATLESILSSAFPGISVTVNQGPDFAF